MSLAGWYPISVRTFKFTSSLALTFHTLLPSSQKNMSTPKQLWATLDSTSETSYISKASLTFCSLIGPVTAFNLLANFPVYKWNHSGEGDVESLLILVTLSGPKPSHTCSLNGHDSRWFTRRRRCCRDCRLPTQLQLASTSTYPESCKGGWIYTILYQDIPSRYAKKG